MKLYQKILAINQGSIFNKYSLNAELFNNKVIAEDKDVGLTDRFVNYFYIRRGSGNIEVKKPEIKLTSRDVREVYTPKVLVLQFQDYKVDDMLQMILRQFGEYQSNLKVETQKDVILKSEIGEIKYFPREVIMISYVEREIVDYCNDLDLFCCGEDVIPTPTPIDCDSADYVVEYENGTLIDSGSIPSGGSRTIEVPNPIACADADYIVEYENGTPIESGTIPSGGSATIEVPDPLVFVDPTYLVEYTDGELISSGTLASGENLVVQVPKTLTIDLPYLDGDTTNTYPIVTSNTYGVVNTITTSLTNFVIKLDGVVVTTPFVISALNSEITTQHDAATINGTIELGGNGA